MENEKIYGEEAEQPTAEETIMPDILEDEEEFEEEIENIEDTPNEEEDQEETLEEIALEDDEAEKPEKKPPTQKEIDKIIQNRIREENRAKKAAQLKNDELLKIAKDALKGLINDGESVETALKRIAAENLNMTLDEYDNKVTEEAELREFKLTKEQRDIENAKALHLAQIKKAYPTITATRIEEIPNYAAYRELMLTGKLSPVKAFLAANVETISALQKTDTEEEYARQRALNDSKAHIRATNSRTVASTMSPIPKDEYEYWKDVFPEASNGELTKKYNEYMKQRR